MNFIETSLAFIGSTVAAVVFTILFGVIAKAWWLVFSFGWNLLL